MIGSVHCARMTKPTLPRAGNLPIIATEDLLCRRHEARFRISRRVEYFSSVFVCRGHNNESEGEIGQPQDCPNLDYATGDTGLRDSGEDTDMLKTDIALSSPIAHCFL